MFLLLLVLLLFIPIPIYFKLNQQGLYLAWFHLPIHHQEKKPSKKKRTRSRLKNIIKVRKITLMVGYQCEDIFDSMELYMFYLVVFPNIYVLLKYRQIETKISIQYLPYQNSELTGMFTFTLVKLILERLRRLCDESSNQ